VFRRVHQNATLRLKSASMIALLYLPSEWSETGGDYVFTFVFVRTQSRWFEWAEC